MDMGWIGTGLMGTPMAQRILEAQMPLMVYNRTAAKVVDLQAAGAKIAASPAIAIAESTAIVLMLSDAAAIHATLFTDEARAALAGKTIIQMGTIAPAESQAIQAQVVAAGGGYLEAPVLGSIPEARSGKLIVMVGGTPAQFEHWLPVLRCFGPDPILLGPVRVVSC